MSLLNTPTCQVPITGNGNAFHFLITSPVNEPFKISVLHLPFILKTALVLLVTTARGEQRNNSSGKTFILARLTKVDLGALSLEATAK